MTKPTGYVLFEDHFRVAIITGFRKSKNAKTGAMFQVWILVKAENPLAAVESGKDKIICGMCPHRGSSCYVDKSRAPLAIWRKWNRGGYPLLTDYEILRGKLIRFGAYGDPAFVPLRVWQGLAAVSAGFTGYTHQWQQPWAQGLKTLVMASCDSIEEQIKATGMGWRTFRVKRESEVILIDEVSCPASVEMGKRTSCEKCKLCCGTTRKAKNIVINVHGNFTKSFAN
jgi:hypothetical protein